MKSLKRVWAAAQRNLIEDEKGKNLSGAEGRKSQGALARLCEFPMPKATIEIPMQYERISRVLRGFFF